jgi:sphinganine-1-phosphate aldolase
MAQFCTSEIMEKLRLILSPPDAHNLRKLEHIVFLLFCVKLVKVSLSLIRMGPAKAWKQIVGTIFGSLKILPGFDNLLEKGMENELKTIRQGLLGDGDADALFTIPNKGLQQKEISKRLIDVKGLAKGFASGKAWGGVYHEESGNLTAIQNEAWSLFNCSNSLYPQTFPGIRKFEAEIVSMTLGIVHGHEHNCVGLLSSGGTESILLAVLAYREQGRKKGITEPEIVCGISAHPALFKGCHYFGVKLVKVGLNSKMEMDVKQVARACNSNTVAIYASAPTFTHGIVDPIEELSDLALRKGVGLHVDNCLGGFLLSYMAKLGIFNQPFDFEVPGVTSMSVDVHKYGYASKGASVVAFRDNELRRGSYVPSVDGCEGLYVTPTLQGSRSGAIIAQAWATIVAVGDNGYEKMASDTNRIMELIIDTVTRHPDLELLVTPSAAIIPVVCAKGSSINIYQVASVLEKKGWNMFTGQHPPVMSACIGESHNKVIDEWVHDLEDAVKEVKENPNMKLEGNCAVYGAASALPDEVLDSVLRSYCDIRMEVKAK